MRFLNTEFNEEVESGGERCLEAGIRMANGKKPGAAHQGLGFPLGALGRIRISIVSADREGTSRVRFSGTTREEVREFLPQGSRRGQGQGDPHLSRFLRCHGWPLGTML